MGVARGAIAVEEWRHVEELGVDVTRTGRERAWRRLRRDPVFWVGGALAAGVVLASALAPLITPVDPIAQFRDALPLTGEAAQPSERFPLGTDVQGRDYLSRLLHAGRTTLAIALIANVLATTIGLVVGAVAAMAPAPRLPLPAGRGLAIPVESLLMRLTDLWLAFPVLLLAIALAFVVGASAGLVTILIGGTLWTLTARLVYGRARVLLRAGFVEAARALGAGQGALLGRHLLPHLLPLLVVIGSLGIASAVLFETTLSFLGAGVPAPAPTWGTMVADHLDWLATDPRLIVLPALAIMVTVLAFNLLGDALRDALDPHGWDR